MFASASLAAGAHQPPYRHQEELKVGTFLWCIAYMLSETESVDGKLICQCVWGEARNKFIPLHSTLRGCCASSRALVAEKAAYLKSCSYSGPVMSYCTVIQFQPPYHSCAPTTLRLFCTFTASLRSASGSGTRDAYTAPQNNRCDKGEYCHSNLYMLHSCNYVV
jgi:hypothetical protein